MQPRQQHDVLQGTLDLLVLKSLSIEPQHGWGIAHHIAGISRDALRVGQGSLYPALQRLEYRGLVDSRWGNTEEGRRVKVYRLTAAGRRELQRELESWRDYVGAVELILRAT